MAQISDHWSELLDPGIRQFFYIGFSGNDRRQSLIPELFNVRSSALSEEKTLALGGIPATGWNFEDTGRVSYTEPVKGYQETFTHKTFARGIQVEEKLIEDNQVSAALDAAANLGDAAFRWRETAGSNVLDRKSTRLNSSH